MRFNGLTFSTRYDLLHKHPALTFHLERADDILTEYSARCGHVIVHYIFTGEYQHLKPKGSSPNKKTEDEFQTSIEVYRFADFFQMAALKELAQAEMKRLGQGLSVLQLLEVAAKKQFRFESDDKWLRNYIKSLIKPLLGSPPRDDRPNPSEDLRIAGILLKAMLELWHEEKDAGRQGSTKEQQAIAVVPSQTQEEQNGMSNEDSDSSSAFTMVE
ncbi:hypothetical protein F4821DRAFT_174499 [Hypoxylon rubiginosum]|uniref:Uncharacterized protein n=1 Tax=Hypoxylon rubiginosum TaxID=110542 RepID=A0ACC0DGC5_9PEZI|nr:hypothetical protein F4821DRAFT_174499 [Hypoxylon rubiginosum]